ncbi:MAG: tetratricopeptide repeat protein [Kyrpidia sp.]|nr:tetratricopeptide repeat protein [Kyrpidia sp.]
MSEPFSELFAKLRKIEQRLAADGGDRSEWVRELAALRARADEWMENWLLLEDRIAELCERFDLDLDPAESLNNEAEGPGNLDFPQGDGPQGSAQEAAKGQGPTVLWHFPPHLDGEQLVRTFRRGIGFFDLWMYEEAIGELEKVVRETGDFPVARLYLALAYIARGRVDEAEPHLQLLLSTERSPWIRTSVYHARAHIRAAQGRWREAAEDLSQAVASRPGIPLLHYNLGVALMRIGRLGDAVAEWIRVVELDCRDEDGWLAGIGALKRLGKFQLAAKWAFHGHRILPDSWKIGGELASLLDYFGHLEEAGLIWKRLIRLHPREAALWTGMGWTRWRMGDRVGARGAWKKSASLDRRQGTPLLYLGWVALEEGDRAAARRFLERAGEDENVRYASQLALGWMDQEEGRRDEASSKWTRVAEEGTGVWKRWAVSMIQDLFAGPQ